MIKNKNDLKEFLEYESKKYGLNSTKIRFLLIREVDVLYKYNYLLRKTEYYKNSNKKISRFIYHSRLKRMSNKYSIHIPLNVFGKGLKLMHVGPILVNGKVKAGENISLHVNTSIVAGGVNNQVPILGDGIIVGVGAVILGGITLANDIAVGANSVVNKSFLINDIAIGGVPAKKISDNGSNSWRNN